MKLTSMEGRSSNPASDQYYFDQYHCYSYCGEKERHLHCCDCAHETRCNAQHSCPNQRITTTRKRMKMMMKKREASPIRVSITVTPKIREAQRFLESSFAIVSVVQGGGRASERDVAAALERGWPGISCSVRRMADADFLVQFPCEAFLREKVLCMKEIHSEHFVLGIRRWSPLEGSFIPKKAPLAVWVALINFPRHCWEWSAFQELVKEFAELLEVDSRIMDRSKVDYVRLKIGCDDLDDIPDMVEAQVDKNWYKVMIAIEQPGNPFENLWTTDVEKEAEIHHKDKACSEFIDPYQRKKDIIEQSSDPTNLVMNGQADAKGISWNLLAREPVQTTMALVASRSAETTLAEALLRELPLVMKNSFADFMNQMKENAEKIGAASISYLPPESSLMPNNQEQEKKKKEDEKKMILEAPCLDKEPFEPNSTGMSQSSLPDHLDRVTGGPSLGHAKVVVHTTKRGGQSSTALKKKSKTPAVSQRRSERNKGKHFNFAMPTRRRKRSAGDGLENPLDIDEVRSHSPSSSGSLSEGMD